METGVHIRPVGNRRFDEANTTMPSSFANPAVTDPTVSTANNRLTSTGYTYDNAGNTLTDANSQTFTYDGENKQIQVNSGSTVLGQYYYDGDGKRVKKVVPGTGETTIFVYDAAGKQIAEYSTIVTASADAKVNYLTSDHLGSPRINTDQNGLVITRHDYHPFGEEIGGSGGRTAGLNYGSDTVRKQFTGKERDVESGLDYFEARYYSSTLGRFVNPDEFSGGPDELFDFADAAAENPTFYANLEKPQSLNKYQYAYSNPYRYLDLDGHEASESTNDCPPLCPAQITMPMPWWIELTLPKIGPTIIDPIILPNGNIYRGKTFTDEGGNIVDENFNILRPASRSVPRTVPAEAGGRAQPQVRPRPNQMARPKNNTKPTATPKEHTKGARPSTSDKHTKPRSGDKQPPGFGRRRPMRPQDKPPKPPKKKDIID